MLNRQLQFIVQSFLMALFIAFNPLNVHALIEADTLPAQSKAYQGMRIHLHDIQVSKMAPEWIKITYVAINTGREDLRFGQAHLNHLKKLVIDFDEAFYESQLVNLKAEIEKKLYYEDLTLFAGAIHRKKEMKIEWKGDAFALNKNLVEKEKNKTNKKTEEESFSINLGDPDEANNFWDKTTCPDLVISELKVLKKSKKSVTLQYTIVNRGKGSANLFGKKKGNDDNVAFKAHLSRSGKLNRGAIVIGGDFIKDLPKENKGMLRVGESHTSTIKLDIRKMTRFTPVIILELDTYQSVRECDERNNRNHVKIEL